MGLGSWSLRRGVKRELGSFSTAEGARLALHAIPPEMASQIEITDPPEMRSETPIKLIFRTGGLDEVCSRLQSLGGAVLAPRPPGSRDAVDPEENVLKLERA